MSGQHRPLTVKVLLMKGPGDRRTAKREYQNKKIAPRSTMTTSHRRRRSCPTPSLTLKGGRTPTQRQGTERITRQRSPTQKPDNLFSKVLDTHATPPNVLIPQPSHAACRHLPEAFAPCEPSEEWEHSRRPNSPPVLCTHLTQRNYQEIDARCSVATGPKMGQQ